MMNAERATIKNKLRELGKFYDFPITDIAINFIVFITENDLICYSEKVYKEYIGIAKVIKILKSCSDITISGTMKAGNSESIKGIFQKIQIQNDIAELVETSLENILKDNLCDYEFHDALRQKGYNTEEDFEEVFEEEYKKPYTIEKIDSLIYHYESSLRDIEKYTMNAKLGRHLLSINNILMKESVFPEESTITKKYSFLYDIMVIIEKFTEYGKSYSGEEGKEKYRQVKNMMNAYLNQSKKI